MKTQGRECTPSASLSAISWLGTSSFWSFMPTLLHPHLSICFRRADPLFRCDACWCLSPGNWGCIFARRTRTSVLGPATDASSDAAPPILSLPLSGAPLDAVGDSCPWGPHCCLLACLVVSIHVCLVRWSAWVSPSPPPQPKRLPLGTCFAVIISPGSHTWWEVQL